MELSYHLMLIQKHFDIDYYFTNNKDLEPGVIDPIEHYIHYGWKENRDPSPNFSTSYYIAKNPDIAKSNINPFLHHTKNGL